MWSAEPEPVGLLPGSPDGAAAARRARTWSRLVADLTTMGEELEADLGRLAVSDGDVRSLCAGWSVRDVVVHLVVGDELAARALRGEDCFPVPTSDEHVLGAQSRERVDAFGDVGLAEACRLFGQGRDRLLALVRDLATPLRLGKVPWVARPITRLALLQSRLMETWVHGRDVRAPLGLASRIDDRCWWINDLGVRHVPYAVRQAGLDLRLHVDVSLDGPGGGTWRTATSPDAKGAVSIAGPAWAWTVAVAQRTLGRDDAMAELRRPPAADPIVHCARAFA